jgi:hypothetical protein
MDVVNQLIETFRARLRANFLLRWVLANVVGWTLGLNLSSYSLALVTPALCFGGAFAGLCVGAAQWWALKTPTPPPRPTSGQPLPEFREGEENAGESPIAVERNWIGLTVAGAIAGGLPAFGMSLLVALGWGLGTAVVGGIFGAGVGIAQYFILQRGLSRAEWWIAANMAGGALCALLTLAPLIRGLPIGLLLGTAIYGYITGRALLWLQDQPPSRQERQVEDY